MAAKSSHINCLHHLHLPPSFLLPTTTTTTLLRSLRSLRLPPTRRGIKSISDPPHQSRFNLTPGLPELGSSTTAALARKAYTPPLRPGALGTKTGMSARYDLDTGARSPVTVVQLDRVQVVAHKTRGTHGYYAVQVGCGYKDPANVTRPLLGHFSGQGVSPKRHLAEFRVRGMEGLVPLQL